MQLSLVLVRLVIPLEEALLSAKAHVRVVMELQVFLAPLFLMGVVAVVLTTIIPTQTEEMAVAAVAAVGIVVHHHALGVLGLQVKGLLEVLVAVVGQTI